MEDIMKIIVFFERQNKSWMAYAMAEHPDWERFLIFEEGVNSKQKAIEKVLEWKKDLPHEVHVDFSRTPGTQRSDKTVIYFKRHEDLFYVKFLFKYGGVWHYVYLSETPMTKAAALIYANNWLLKNKAAYEIYISEDIFS
jgi:hypothetical protein